MGKLALYQEPRMKYLSVLLLVVPTLSLPTSRSSCPTMQEVKDWIEDNTGFQVPDVVEECLTGGNDCPYESFEDAVVALESLGIQVPDSVGQCLSGDMDACEDVVDAVEAALGIEIPEEFLEMASACMAEIMEEVGTRSLMRNSCPTMEEVKDWVEDVTGFQVPDIVEECLTGGNGCPYESVEDAVAALESSLDIEVPDSVEECLSGDMDGCEDALAAVEAALGIEIPVEFIEMATACISEVGL